MGDQSISMSLPLQDTTTRSGQWAIQLL